MMQPGGVRWNPSPWGGLKQEDLQFWVSQGYRVKSCLKNKTEEPNKTTNPKQNNQYMNETNSMFLFSEW